MSKIEIVESMRRIFKAKFQGIVPKAFMFKDYEILRELTKEFREKQELLVKPENVLHLFEIFDCHQINFEKAKDIVVYSNGKVVSTPVSENTAPFLVIIAEACWVGVNSLGDIICFQHTHQQPPHPLGFIDFKQFINNIDGNEKIEGERIFITCPRCKKNLRRFLTIEISALLVGINMHGGMLLQLLSTMIRKIFRYGTLIQKVKKILICQIDGGYKHRVSVSTLSRVEILWHHHSKFKHFLPCC